MNTCTHEYFHGVFLSLSYFFQNSHAYMNTFYEGSQAQMSTFYIVSHAHMRTFYVVSFITIAHERICTTKPLTVIIPAGSKYKIAQRRMRTHLDCTTGMLSV